VKIDGADVQLNFYDDILGHMTRDQKMELASMICWDDDVLEDFVDRLMTETAGEHIDSHIHRARQKFISLMPEGAASLIRGLLREVETSKKSLQEYQQRTWDMENFYPTATACREPGCFGVVYHQKPERRKWEFVSTPTADEIMKNCGFEPVNLKTTQEEL
jgi:hypothetical protein